MQMEQNTIEVIRIACKYIIKRAFKLFDNNTRVDSLQQIVSTLRLTSKELNKSICDELSLEIMHRWMKGLDRCALITKRIERLLQKDDNSALFRYMDAVVKIFARRESVRVLSSFLVIITQHHKHLLKDYIEFFTSRDLHMTMKEYFEQQRDFPFPGFKSEHVEKSLQIANENGWVEESIILFEHFVAYYLVTDQDQGMRSALKRGEKLNFDCNLANRINSLMQKRDAMNWFIQSSSYYQAGWLALYFDAKQKTTTDVMEILHNISQRDAAALFVKRTINSSQYCRIISFKGSQLVKFCHRRYDVIPHSVHELEIRPKAKSFTGLIPEPASCQKIYLYHFYLAVVGNDIETAKQIHQQYGIIESDFGHHPHPLSEYLQAVIKGKIEPIQEMIDFLVGNFDGIKGCLKGLDCSTEQVDKFWTLFKPLIDKGAVIDCFNIWKRLFYENIPRNVRDFKVLLDKIERQRTSIINFLLDEFSIRSLEMISETKKILLLGWRFGGDTCHLSKLPKELLKLILEFVDEPPLFIQYVDKATENYDTWYPVVSRKTLERTGEIAKFFRDLAVKTRFMNGTLWHGLQNYESEKIVKRDAQHLRYLFTINNKNTNITNLFPVKIHRYFCKYETDDKLLERLVTEAREALYWYSKFPLVEYAVVAKNMALLQAFYRRPENINYIPPEQLYNSVAPNRKNKMSYQEALALLNQVRSQHTALLWQP